jgi:hypothetical protein
MNSGRPRLGVSTCPGMDTAVLCTRPGRILAARPGHRQRRAPLLTQGNTAGEGDAGSGTLTTMEIQKQADQASADQFFESVARLGASPVPGATYSGATSPVPLICVVGHACTATPSSVQRGQEICETCADLGPFPA